MNCFIFFTVLIAVPVLQLSAARAPVNRELINFGNPLENPPDIAATLAQIEASLAQETAQANTLDPSILAELEQSYEPVIRIFQDQFGNQHSATYTKNANGTITKKQTGNIMLNDLSKIDYRIPGVGTVPVDQLQESEVVRTALSADNLQQYNVFRRNFKTDDTVQANTPIYAIAATTTTTPSSTSATTNTASYSANVDAIFSELNTIFDTSASFRPMLLRLKDCTHDFIRNTFNLFNINEESSQAEVPQPVIKETRIASDGKTVVTLYFWPSIYDSNSILIRAPLTRATIKTQAGRDIVTRAAQKLKANNNFRNNFKSKIYSYNNGLVAAEFVIGQAQEFPVY